MFYEILARVIRTPGQRKTFLPLQSVALPTELSRVYIIRLNNSIKKR